MNSFASKEERRWTGPEIRPSKYIQLTDVTELKKEWDEENGEHCKVVATFGLSKGYPGTPFVAMQVYRNGQKADDVMDENCDIWDNGAQFTNKDDGNEYYKMLIKHGFKKVK